MSARADDFPHERRAPSLRALDTRLRAVESWMDSFRLEMGNVASEVQANTRLTEEIHGKTEEMYGIFDTARNGFNVLASIGNFLVRVGQYGVRALEFLGRIARPVFWVAAIASASWAWWKTGAFAMPGWWHGMGE